MSSLPRLQSVGPAALVLLVGLGLGLGPAQAATSLQTCLASCKRAGLSATNRASCRLDCEADAASDPEVIRGKIAPLTRPATSSPRAAGTTVASARGPACKAGCDADGSLSEDDRATCKLECDLEPAPMPTGTPPPMRPPRTTSPPSTPTTSTPVPAAGSQAEFLGRCHATCTPGSNARAATDFESCKLDCQTMASVLDVASTLVPDAWLESPRSATPIATPTPRATPPVVTPKPTRPRAAPVANGGDTCGPALQTCRADCVKAEAKCARACGRKHLSETDRETCKLGCGTDQEVCQGDCLTATATCVNSRYAPRE